MKSLASLVLISAALVSFAPSRASAAIEQEIEKGLYFVRVADLDKETATVSAALAHEDVIIDLRYTKGSVDAAATFAAHLHSAPNTPTAHRLILLTPTTSPAIIDALSEQIPHVLTLSPRSEALNTDIQVNTSAEIDRTAYDAVNSGTALDKVISSNPEKRRFDEAALAHERAAAAELPADDEDQIDAIAGTTQPTPANPEAAKKSPVAPHDRVLERAIQINRALLVMKR
ncbi:MAG TPA: hypothetical protein VFT72_09310 [Opitutaceae bacterium]|nr:hypothetical protein [Opitutaceae bacterium]